MTAQQKIIVVIGPTASGKSELAIKLARQHNGEIISADSRQVYRDLNIGTGKVPGHWTSVTAYKKMDLRQVFHGREKPVVGKMFIYKSIPHHVIDFVSPNTQYTAADFKRDGSRALLDIVSRGKIPVICGGTGQYVDALLFDQAIPEVAPNPEYRKKLEAKSAAQLFALLRKKDPARANTIDPHNPRRLIRALEIVHATGKPVPPPPVIPEFSALRKRPESSSKDEPGFPSTAEMTTFIEIHYLNPPREQLYQRIEKRLKEWLKGDLLFKEIQKLRTQRVSWKRIAEFGLEYKSAAEYLRGRIDYATMYAQSLKSIQHYAKRQQTWFKKYEPLIKRVSPIKPLDPHPFPAKKHGRSNQQ